MTYGCEGWLLTRTLRQRINGFNSLRLVAITGRTPHEEAKTPAYNLVYHLLHIRWQYAGNLLRRHNDDIARRELLITILMILLKDISHKGTLVMNFPFNKLDPAKGALPADICRAAGWQDPREPIEIATPVRRATVECNQKKWAEYGIRLEQPVKKNLAS
jgi:hypothetical protein